ncbi:MAG: hypothetical protein WA705_07105 [Candidatus Ozemobacteraceae bacterium]
MNRYILRSFGSGFSRVTFSAVFTVAFLLGSISPAHSLSAPVFTFIQGIPWVLGQTVYLTSGANITFIGTAPNNSTVNLYRNNEYLSSTSDDFGSWSLTYTPVPEGFWSFDAETVHGATSGRSSPALVNIDLHAPLPIPCPNWTTSFQNATGIQTANFFHTVVDWGTGSGSGILFSTASQTLLDITNAEAPITISCTLANNGVDTVTFTPSNITLMKIENHTYTVFFQINDRAGNSATCSKTYTYDNTAPTGSISINGGATYAESTTVTLTLAAVDVNVITMRFSNDGISWSASEPYATSRTWTLPSGDFLKSVYVKYQDSAGNESGSIQSSIILDTTSPAPSEGNAFAINGAITTSTSELTTGTTSAFLRFFVSDPSGVVKASISNDELIWTDIANPPLAPASVSWTLDSTPGPKTVYVKFTDGLGHETVAPYFTQIISYYPQNSSVSGLLDSNVFPIDTYDEYQDQNKYGGGLGASEGRALRLRKP